jgi:ABC-type phosphate/phosphonate transport system substrate-binding protein
MYDPPELRREVDAWWAALAAAFRNEGIGGVPDRLDRGIAFDALWSAPDLLFAQACGYPLMGAWSDRLRYLATPCYAAPGCDGPNYCSFLVVPAGSAAQRVEDLRGTRCSINARISHSGYNALRAHFAPLARDGRFFGEVLVSGGHSESIAQLGAGDVDIAAIDCVTYALLSRCRPHAIAATRIIGRTTSAPGLPYVTRANADPVLVRRLQAGLAQVFSDPSLADLRASLLLSGLDTLPPGSYRCMTDMESDAARRQYFELG